MYKNIIILTCEQNIIFLLKNSDGGDIFYASPRRFYQLFIIHEYFRTTCVPGFLPSKTTTCYKIYKTCRNIFSSNIVLLDFE